jgi:hypothetical protein
VRAGDKTNTHDPEIIGLPGAWEQFTYFQSITAVFVAPRRNSPTQSVPLGETIPLQAAVIVPVAPAGNPVTPKLTAPEKLFCTVTVAV